MDPVHQIQKLGWDWRSDGLGMGLGPGVLLSVQVDGKVLRAFVPLSRVWEAFDQELQAVGCIDAASVGAPYSVGGFFSFVKKAVKSVSHAATSVAKAVVPKAIQRAASSVVSTAKRFGSAALHAVSKIPVLGTAVNLALLPATAANQLLAGKRIDRIAMDQFHSALKGVKTLAPYVQTVISFVPGVGTGISAGLGGALALASGQSISEAMLAAAKSAIPGGPAAQAAFSIASDVMQGKPITTIAVDALPVSPEAKRAVLQGLHAAKALASGQKVSQVFLDNALQALPPAARTAVQVGVALGHAKNLQEAAGAAVQGAQSLAASRSAGLQAAQHFAQGIRTPAVIHALTQAEQSRQALSHIAAAASAGHQQARHVLAAYQQIHAAPFPVLAPRPSPAPRPMLRPNPWGLFA